MTFKRITLFAAMSACMLLLMASCSEWSVRTGPVIRPGPGNGPPAHAKAHGYRNKQVAGVELVFDSRLGVYVVVGHTDCYYHDGYFYRQRGGLWEMSLKPDSGWASVSIKSLPAGLQAKSNGNGKGHGNVPPGTAGAGKNKRTS